MPYVYLTPHPQVHEETVEEYGLRFPDGTEIWPPQLFKDKLGYQDPADRATIAAALAEGVKNMSLPVRDTLDQYQWLVRVKRVLTVTTYDEDVDERPVDDPCLTQQAQYEDQEQE
ncbi:hypothetical protein SEA_SCOOBYDOOBYDOO_85 [Mycobacterium phage ScoobyDoobyDoo]|nr:hypothetical protein SEA_SCOOBYDOOBYDOO_85 [Mycobacterium phage ScoobyDoobyDoo]